MLEQLSSLALLGNVFAMTINEKRRISGIFTPFTVTAWPLAIISIAVNFFLVEFGFPYISARVNLFLLINLIFIWFVGYVFSHFLLKSNRQRDLSTLFSQFRKYNTLTVLIAWISIIITMLKVLSLIQAKGGFWFIGTREYEEMMAGGLVSHMIQLSRVCFILLFFTNKDKMKNPIILITLFFLILAAVANQVKYPFIWIVLIIFFSIYIEKTVKIQMKSLLKLGFLLTIIFLSLMSLVFLSWDLSNTNALEYLFKQFMNYLVSGPIVLDIWLDHPAIKPDWTLLVVFRNTINVILGDPFRFNAIDYVTINFYPVIDGYPSNIGTSFGVFYLIGGLPFSLFMSVLFSSVHYLIFIKSYNSNNQFLIFSNLFLMGVASLSFFGEYFSLLSFWEIPLIFFIILSIFKILDMRQLKASK